ncbi:MAG: hypothetical protein WC356_01780 [Candidatus Micrarchaeia archaeon]
MKALETALSADVAGVDKIHRRDPIGTDLDKIKQAELFFYEDDHDRERGNRHAEGIIRLEMVAFIRLKADKDHGYQTFYDQADEVAAQVYMVMNGSSVLVSPVIRVEEESKRPAIGNEAFGELVLRYRVTYGHALNNPFTTTLT